MTTISVSRMPFKCKFDEQLLGFADNLKEDEVVKRKFEEPDDFADDLVVEGIRGADDEMVVAAATEAERTIITNDVDYFFTTKNKYGTIVLRGSVHREDGTIYPFHRFTKENKRQVIRHLFLHHVKEMQRIRDGCRTELALLSGNCRTLKIAEQKQKPRIILSQIHWQFRDATEDDRVQFMRFKERQGQEENLPEIMGTQAIATANSRRSQSIGNNAFSGQQLTPITPTSLDLQSPNNPHVCDTSERPCLFCNSPITQSGAAAYPSP
ncbi:hypothetical protein BC937DRAFT_92753 [Endogone sp. FLAS-F59071]|nr:hypothetical protein BC937DRAFT_92753 [Endogone sp. FLAS-F59071]|eukprot:RUS21418.1 hypothetical protein BC937DRAFT_92753 [Endogone sp. FLAS-F59071]